MEPPYPQVRRKIITAAISGLLTEIGIHTSERMALETLVELFQAFLTEFGQTARNYTELAGRTEPLLGDILLTLVDLGLNLNGLEKFTWRQSRTILPVPQVWQPQKQMNMLHAGIQLPLPSHVPSYFPEFPYPHAYIRTPTHKQPVTEYEAIREKAATQKRDMERALTKFVARTGPTHNLYQTEDSNIYPLIACKRLTPPYLSALLPQDQIFDPEDLEYDPRDDPANQEPETKEVITNVSKKKGKPEETTPEIQDEESNTENSKDEMPSNVMTTPHLSTASKEAISNENAGMNTPDIDNPYLRATKMPRKKLITKINVSNNTCSSSIE